MSKDEQRLCKLRDRISEITGFDLGDKLDSPKQVYDYIRSSLHNDKQMFGSNAKPIYNEELIEEWSEAVIENEWHCVEMGFWHALGMRDSDREVLRSEPNIATDISKHILDQYEWNDAWPLIDKDGKFITVVDSEESSKEGYLLADVDETGTVAIGEECIDALIAPVEK